MSMEGRSKPTIYRSAELGCSANWATDKIIAKAGKGRGGGGGGFLRMIPDY